MNLSAPFIARPVGAVAFGHFGDRIGRKSTLVWSLMLMGGSTMAIAFLPTYAQAGWIAPLLLCVLLLNMLPSNPYFLSTLQEWVQGKFLNFNGAAQFLSLAWPVFALWFLLHPAHRTPEAAGV